MEFYRYLHMATGSTSDLEHHIPWARDLRFLDEATYKSLDDKIVELRRCWLH